MTEAQWFTSDASDIPHWKRSVAVVGQEVYVSPAWFGSPLLIFLSAAFDGAGVVQDGQHVYVPVSWLAEEFPHLKDDLTELALRLLEAAKAHDTGSIDEG